jgi:CheY-like chemotaxis protein
MKNEDARRQPATPRWMIVDDNEEILLLMRDIAAQFSDTEIECFNSPHAALAGFRAAPENFELVITDFEMPGMNGVELCHRLRAILPSVKILLTTGSGLVGAEAAANEGFCGLLHKPFPFASLQRALAAAGLLEIPAENNSKKIAALTMA